MTSINSDDRISAYGTWGQYLMSPFLGLYKELKKNRIALIMLQCHEIPFIVRFYIFRVWQMPDVS